MNAVFSVTLLYARRITLSRTLMGVVCLPGRILKNAAEEDSNAEFDARNPIWRGYRFRGGDQTETKVADLLNWT